MSRYAEILRHGEAFPMLARFDDTDARDAAAVAFDGVFFLDMTYRDARKTYDLRRFGRERYVIPVTIGGITYDAILRSEHQRAEEKAAAERCGATIPEEWRVTDDPDDVFGLRQILEILGGDDDGEA